MNKYLHLDPCQYEENECDSIITVLSPFKNSK